MEKELLISKLKENIGTTNISDKTMDVYATSILPTITSDEMVNDAFLAAHGNVLKTMAGQISHDASVEINRYKEEHPVNVDTKKEDQSRVTVDQEILDRLQKLENQHKEREEKARKEELKRQVMEGMKAKGANDSYVLKNALRDVDIDVTKSVDELVDSLLPNYDKEYKEARGDGGTPRSSQDGGTSGDKESLDNFFAQKALEGKFPKKQE